MALTYRSTKTACYLGYVVQAISINLAPLLYVTFQKEYALSLPQISLFIAFNFGMQMFVDVLAGRFSHKMNLRFCIVLANVSVVLGLVGLSVLPTVLPPLAGLLVAALLLGAGGGFTEVMVSPLMEAIPSDGKAGNMSLLHSFYCWGHAGVVLFSSVYFHFFAIEKSWRYLPIIWAILPVIGAVLFLFVPIYRLPEDPDRSVAESRRQLFRSPVFYAYFVMMFCGGAAEMVIAQWASTYVEEALNLSKSVGDLLGPCMFAVTMGSVRALYGVFSKKIALETFMKICCGTCIVGYLTAAFSSASWMSLAGCAICGFSVAVLWPGLLSKAAAAIPYGGISMFALLALSGDIGCLLGPVLIGSLSDLLGGLRYGFCLSICFPVLYFLILVLAEKKTVHGKDRMK